MHERGTTTEQGFNGAQEQAQQLSTDRTKDSSGHDVRERMVAFHSSQHKLIPDATKTQRFNLSKRRRAAPTTGSSNQQLVTQSQHILPTQLLIKFHQLQATVLLTHVDIWNALQLIPCISATVGFHETTVFYSRAINC
ncbi:putative WRKY transcription factor 42 [Dorcoceras hygrometricum]|uniref:Putative WRKY transcription factor 42 n=1 Tax=Dorcoceras hygrometricum TaxID=472368 RepID=A0A2Z7CLG5_9LAMI|nr:putative WRKY transcription factor 42 [Dorcoceras hygrometricum]